MGKARRKKQNGARDDPTGETTFNPLLYGRFYRPKTKFFRGGKTKILDFFFIGATATKKSEKILSGMSVFIFFNDKKHSRGGAWKVLTLFLPGGF